MATHALTPVAAPATRGWLYGWLTTTDHKKIGIMYVVNSFVFFMVGGVLALVVRTELAQPGLQFLTDEHVYNEMFTMHATVMIFLFIIPMLAGLGNYAVPLHDRGAGHGVPADQRPVAVDAAAGRHPPRFELLHRRRAGGRLDLLSAAVGRRPAQVARLGAGPLDRVADPHRDELDPRRRSTSW